MLDDTLHADVLSITLAVELEWLIVEGAELMVFSNLLLLAGQLEHDEVFAEHIGLDLRVVLEAAGRTVQEFFLFEDDAQTLLADCVPTV